MQENKYIIVRKKRGKKYVEIYVVFTFSQKQDTHIERFGIVQ